jgi:uncharacterized repeat protein (TIGR03943 family)
MKKAPGFAMYAVAAVYLMWAGSLGWLLVSSRYQAFLRPGFWALLLWALGILLAFVLAMIRFKWPFRISSQGATLWVRLCVIAMPLIYLLAAEDRPLGSQALKNRVYDPRLMEKLSGKKADRIESGNPELTLLEILQNFKSLEGKRIITEGMIHRDEVVPQKHFLVFRFMIVCCAADALPAGALVFHEDADSFEQDSWVRVEGMLGLKQVGDLFFPIIQADHITRITPPKNPYLFPRLF